LFVEDFIGGTAFLLLVVGGLALIAYSIRGRQRMRELVMRERIALIERGLVPPPEVDPKRFEALVHPPDVQVRFRSPGAAARGARYRSAGVMVIGFGAALFLLLAAAADLPGIGFGIGGGFVILGAAMFINGMLLAHGPVPPMETPPVSSAPEQSTPPSFTSSN
jgi:hypothetical protein